jgi:hypothetical protein
MRMNFRHYDLLAKALAPLMVCACADAGLCSPQSAAETAPQIFARAVQAHGGQQALANIVDWVGNGRIAITGGDNNPSGLTLTVKSGNKVQRIVTYGAGGTVRYGSDGMSTWQSSGPFSSVAIGRADYFIQSQAGRSIPNLLADVSNGYSFSDLGPAGADAVPANSPARIIQARNGAGQITRYYVDNATSLISRLEFDTGDFYTMPFDAAKHPLVAAYVFSDYRSVNGVMTPFKIEAYLGLVKIEQVNFVSVQYNAGVSDGVFVP